MSFQYFDVASQYFEKILLDLKITERVHKHIEYNDVLSYGQYLAMEISNTAYNHPPVNQPNTRPPSAYQIEVVQPVN